MYGVPPVELSLPEVEIVFSCVLPKDPQVEVSMCESVWVQVQLLVPDWVVTVEEMLSVRWTERA